MNKFFEAVKSADVGMAKKCMDAGAGVNDKNRDGDIPLYEAALWVRRGKLSERVKLVKLLIRGGADVNARNNSGATPLHALSIYLTCEKKENPEIEEIVKALVENGADVNALNARGETPLDMAVICRAWGLFITLAKHGADLKAALGYAVDPAMPVSTLKSLLDLCQDINSSDEDGVTLLQGALSNRESETINVVKLLLQKGVDVNAADKRGYTALHLIAYNDAPEVAARIAALLLGYGAEVNPVSKHGFTPLDLAQSSAVKKILKALGGKTAPKPAGGPGCVQKTAVQKTGRPEHNYTPISKGNAILHCDACGSWFVRLNRSRMLMDTLSIVPLWPRDFGKTGPFNLDKVMARISGNKKRSLAKYLKAKGYGSKDPSRLVEINKYIG